MRFAWTDEQIAFAEATRQLLADRCPPAVVRAAAEAPPGALDRSVWDALDALGVLGLLAPATVPAGHAGDPGAPGETGEAGDPGDAGEAGARTEAGAGAGREASGPVPGHRAPGGGEAVATPGVAPAGEAGGLGLDECFAVPVIEEAGRAGLPHPLVDTACVAAPLGAGGGGRLVVTDLGGGLVPCASDADAFVLAGPPAPGSTREDRGKAALYLVERAVVTVEPVATVDRGRRAGRVAWSPGDGRLLTDDPVAVRLAYDRGVLGTAAELCGLARAMLDMTVAYVGERRQFGAPVGSFQAVKHHLANALLQLEFARPAVARAAWSVSRRDVVGEAQRSRDVSMAKALASDAAGACGRAALQCHGAIGYTVEHDLHLFLKRSWALARAWGDRSFHADRVGRALAARPAPTGTAGTTGTATGSARAGAANTYLEED